VMGSVVGEPGWHASEVMQHAVRIDHRLALGRHEVSRGEFALFVRSTGYRTEAEAGDGCAVTTGPKFEQSATAHWRQPGFDQGDDHPVVCTSHNDALAYVRWLNQRAPGVGYRLPSEAEWEYAARAGSRSRYPWGDDAGGSAQCAHANGADQRAKAKVPGTAGWTVANCDDGHAYTAPARALQPNAFGLYNLQGNAWEWLQDAWHENYSGAPTDGSAWMNGGNPGGRMVRGGSWANSPQGLRSASRDAFPPDYRRSDTGFRVARTL